MNIVIYFILWVIIHCYFIYLFCCSIFSTFEHWEFFSWFLYPFDTPLSWWAFWVLLYFLALQDTLASSCIVPVPVLESASSSRNSSSFYWRMILETKIWELVIYVFKYLLITRARHKELTKWHILRALKLIKGK